MSYIIDLIKGFLIGTANIIPGISGGTFALILGIYERLINAISNINGLFLKDLAARKFSSALKKIDFWFLCRIALGALTAIILLSRIIEFFLEEQHDFTYSFFLGLIIPSIAVPWTMMQQKKGKEVLWFLIGLAFLLVLSIGFGYLNDQKLELKNAAENLTSALPHSFWQLLLALVSGALAISAMILPGISGSFVLLLLGQYRNAVHAVNERDLIFLAAFGSGVVIGILLFTRLLKFLLQKYHSQTIAFLIGLMVSSLYTLWPFKETALIEGKLFYTSQNILPQINPQFWFSLLIFAGGFALVSLFLVIEKKFNKA